MSLPATQQAWCQVARGLPKTAIKLIKDHPVPVPTKDDVLVKVCFSLVFPLFPLFPHSSDIRAYRYRSFLSRSETLLSTLSAYVSLSPSSPPYRSFPLGLEVAWLIDAICLLLSLM
jgi:hypothetical protein